MLCAICGESFRILHDFPMHLDPLRPSESDPHIIDSDRIEALEVDNSENSVVNFQRFSTPYPEAA